jgi:glutamate mutase epsilon subunit
MANTDLTTNSYHSLNSLDVSIQAFVQFAHVLPEHERFAPLLLVLADRLESDFAAMRDDAIKLWQQPEKEE